MTQSQLNRRHVLQAIGATGALAVAGCLGSDTQGSSTESDEPAAESGLPAAKSVDVDRIARDPTDIPDPVDWDQPREHDVTIRTERV
ncbi:twin-arginine translocation signal domain-containing protein, partial [Natrinema sp. JCM 9743]